MLRLTPKEVKLVWLMLDRAAARGEIENAARMFAQSLRARQVKAEEVEKALAKLNIEPAPEPNCSKPDYGLCMMPWGKHRGKMFKEIAPSYFRYVVAWIEDPEGDRLPKMAGLLQDIKCWLAQR
jgi:hypothetical protein